MAQDEPLAGPGTRADPKTGGVAVVAAEDGAGADHDGGHPRCEPDGSELPPSRYRHPGDVIRLILGGAVLIVAVVAAFALAGDVLGSNATTLTATEPDDAGGRLLTGLAQVTVMVAVVAVVVALLRRGRFRLLATISGGAVLAALVLTAVERLVGLDPPARLAANVGRDALVGSAAFPDPAVLAAFAAVAVIVGPWLTHSWRRAVWIALAITAVVRALTGTVLPMELVLAFASGAVVGSGLLVAFGSPDKRIGPDGVAAALGGAGLPVASVTAAIVAGRGARPFLATTADGRRLFVKVLGQDERDADLLYRGYRTVRLRRLGDTRPAASLAQAVEHQALVGLLAEQGGVHVPHVDRVAKGVDGSAMLAMDCVDGRSLEQLRGEEITDEMLERLWTDVDRLHRAGIAHRSLRTANFMIDDHGVPWVVDFSFSELAASERQAALDVAELLASLAVSVGPDRAVSSAEAVVGLERIASAMPLLQPLALSAATRRAVGGQGNLLGRTRAAAAEASGASEEHLAQVQRVKPRTLLMIAVLSGAFYFILPQLAQVGGAWKAFQSADFIWIVPVILMSALTYVASGISMMGSVPQPLAFGPTVLAQVASSFVNRVTPASIGGMVLNTRFLQKSGVDPPTAIAGVGLNSVVGAVVHVALLVVFFVWSGSALGNAFKLPSTSTLLMLIAVVFALAGVMLATRWARRKLFRPLVKGVRSSLGNLRKVAKSPTRLVQLFGGSALTTLAYIAAFAGAVQAFGLDVSVAETGAVFLGGSAIAAAAPTPGGLGALEAALVAGLTGVGVEAGPAVSIVLAFRLATYWLPVAPGWLAWSIMQRRRYV